MSQSEISLSESNESGDVSNNVSTAKISRSFCSISKATLLRIFVNILLAASVPVTLLYVIVPIAFNVFPHASQHIFFLNFVKVPFVDYDDLTLHGVKSIGRQFYLHEKGAKVLCSELETILGVWHILPLELSDKFDEGISNGERQPLSTAEFEALLSSDSHDIVIYFHGNTMDRANSHRVDLYNRLSAMQFHVLTFDYRGYGDSSGYPSEDGLNEDSHFIYNYVREKAPNKHIYVWGHSMGTGVAARFVGELSDLGIAPYGTILEAPFNNIFDATKNHPFSKPWHWLGILFDKLIINRWIETGLKMESDKSIRKFKCPVLIMHSVDDNVIPFNLGQSLAESAKKAEIDVKFIQFEKTLQLHHSWFHRAPHFISILTEFFNYCEQYAKSTHPRNRQQEVHMDN